MASNSKPAAELRIGAVKVTVWENEVGGITRHNVTFSRIYPEGGGSGRPRTASASRTCSPSPSSPIRRTRSSPSATPRQPRGLAITKPAKHRIFGRRVHPRRLFSWTPVPARRRHGLSATITVQDLSVGTLWAGPQTPDTAESEAGCPWLFSKFLPSGLTGDGVTLPRSAPRAGMELPAS